MKKRCFGVGGKESPKGEKVYSCIDEIIKITASVPVSFPELRRTDGRRSAIARQFRESAHAPTRVRSLQ